MSGTAGRFGAGLALIILFFGGRALPVTLVYMAVSVGSMLLATWVLNRFFFRVNDFQFSPEACVYSRGFLSLDQFFEYPPLAAKMSG